MKTKKLNKTSNFYLLLVLIALLCLIFYIMDSCIGKIQNKLEGNKETFTNLSPNSSFSPSEEVEEVEEVEESKLEDNSFMYEIENKDLVLSDFYPTKKVYSKKTPEEMLKFTQDLDLFHLQVR